LNNMATINGIVYTGSDQQFMDQLIAELLNAQREIRILKGGK